MESIKQGANYISEQVNKATSATSKEANKQVAKDSNAPIGTRYILLPPGAQYPSLWNNDN